MNRSRIKTEELKPRKVSVDGNPTKKFKPEPHRKFRIDFSVGAIICNVCFGYGELSDKRFTTVTNKQINDFKILHEGCEF